MSDGADVVEAAKDGTARGWRWILLTGNRLLIALALTVGFFLLLQLLYAAGLIGYADGSPISRMASGMTSGSFSLITIVLTINQLILSQELGTAGQVQSRLEGMLSFRERIESATGIAAAPARPTNMVAILARSTSERAAALSASVEENDERLWTRIDAYADEIGANADDLEEKVTAHDSTFTALIATFDFADQWYIHVGRRLRNRNADRLTAESADAFDDLLELLKLFDVGRSHFETIYLRRELSDLSRSVLVIGVPAVVAALLVNLIYGAGGGTGLAPADLPLAISGLSTVVFAPVAILASYLLRAATVGYNNATVGPMILGREADHALSEEGNEVTAVRERDEVND